MLFDPERRWISRAICRPEDWKIFFPPAAVAADRPASPAVQAAWNRAKALCEQCPALTECRRDTLGEEDGVWGGKDPKQRFYERRSLRKRAKGWAPELRMEWARELWRLRTGGVSWTSIRLMTGIPAGLAEELVWEYRQYLAEQSEPAPKVVDLPLPEVVATPTPFPPKPGRRHGWVRNGPLIADAWYRGQTPDGKWLLMTHYSGRGNVYKWLKASDVQLYRPQPVVILRYGGRPDGPRKATRITAPTTRAPAA